MKIFSGTSNISLAEKIARYLKIKVSPFEIHVFPDEEKRVRVVDKVLGKNCVVIQSASRDADKNYMELFFITDALKRSGAKSVIAVIPYLGYQRQDKVFRYGEAVSLAVIIKILETTGTDKIITFDLHSVRIPELFAIPVIHLSALSLFAGKIREMFVAWGLVDSILVSPDMGGIRRIKILSELTNMPFATIIKNRDLLTGNISMDRIQGGLKKRAIIVDDIISTGSTIVKASDLLRKKGVEEIFVFVTHPVLAGNAPKLLQESGVKKVFVTDTINVPREKQFAKLETLSVAKMISEAIKD